MLPFNRPYTSTRRVNYISRKTKCKAEWCGPVHIGVSDYREAKTFFRWWVSWWNQRKLRLQVIPRISLILYGTKLKITIIDTKIKIYICICTSDQYIMGVQFGGSADVYLQPWICIEVEIWLEEVQLNYRLTKDEESITSMLSTSPIYHNGRWNICSHFVVNNPQPGWCEVLLEFLCLIVCVFFFFFLSTLSLTQSIA